MREVNNFSNMYSKTHNRFLEVVILNIAWLTLSPSKVVSPFFIKITAEDVKQIT